MEYNSKDNPIIVKCTGSSSLPLDRILEFQGNLKRLTTVNRNKLISSICRLGFIAPVFVWDNQSEYSLLDGHQRIKTLIHMREKGWNIPMIPIVFVEALNEHDAREKLSAITSSYGEFNLSELTDWISDFDDEFKEALRFTDEALEISFGDSSSTGSAEGINSYTDKIKAPIYEPKEEEPPEIKTMINPEKAKSLMAEIKAADIKDKELKNFLIAAAQRHVVFSYDKIAEYYSHAEPEIQDLMEKSALVIIDFNKAIENGFVKLTGSLAEAYGADNEEA